MLVVAITIAIKDVYGWFFLRLNKRRIFVNRHRGSTRQSAPVLGAQAKSIGWYIYGSRTDLAVIEKVLANVGTSVVVLRTFMVGVNSNVPYISYRYEILNCVAAQIAG